MRLPAPIVAPPFGTPLSFVVQRPLGLHTPTQAGRPSHLAAGSGMQILGEHMYVIADDEHHLGVFSSTGAEPGTMRRVFAGDLPLDPDDRKKAKPDIEALAFVPEVGLLGVPSGSKTRRHVGFAWRTDSNGALVGESTPVDFAPLYDALRGRVRGTLNIEAAAVRGSELVLLHRNNSAGAVAATVTLDLARLRTQLRVGRVDATAIAAVREYDLGAIDGVALGFTDATALADGRIVFTAAAEVSSDAVDDGEIRGSAVGVLAPDGSIEQLRRIGERGLKIEGVAVVQPPRSFAVADASGTIDLRLVTDADDATKPAQVLAATLTVPAR